MIIFPAGYVATKYPGYFWNVRTQTLASVKIGGELREMKLTKPNYWNRLADRGKFEGGYRVSHKGRNRWLYLEDLKQLEEEHSIFPEYKRKNK